MITSLVQTEFKTSSSIIASGSTLVVSSAILDHTYWSSSSLGERRPSLRFSRKWVCLANSVRGLYNISCRSMRANLHPGRILDYLSVSQYFPTIVPDVERCTATIRLSTSHFVPRIICFSDVSFPGSESKLFLVLLSPILVRNLGSNSRDIKKSCKNPRWDILYNW